MIDMLQNDQNNSYSLLDGAVALCSAIDESMDKIWVLQALNAMTQELRAKVDVQASAAIQLETLIDCFYQDWNFQGDCENV